MNSDWQILLDVHYPWTNISQLDRIEKEYIFKRIDKEILEFLTVLERNKLPKFLLVITPISFILFDDPLFQKEMTAFLKTKLYADSSNGDNHSNSKEHFALWMKWEQNLTKGIKELVKKGQAEVLSTGFSGIPLPFLSTEVALTLQLEYGEKLLVDFLGVKPKGFWFPQGAYTPGLDLLLVKRGYQYSFIMEETIQYADPSPENKETGPVQSPHGLIMFPIRKMINTDFKADNWSNILQTNVVDTNGINILYASLTQLNSQLSDFFAAISQLSINKLFLPNEYIIQLKSDLEIVHLCYSTIIETTPNSNQLTLLKKSYFMEKDLFVNKSNNMSEIQSNLFSLLMKEWFVLTALYAEASVFSNYVENQINCINSLKDQLINNERLFMDNSSMQEDSYVFHLFKQNDHKNNTPNEITELLQEDKRTILVLSWEFPPNIIGGLSRHVYELSKSLTKKGYKVVVLTAKGDSGSSEEIVDGVYVYRVAPLSTQQQFLTWIANLNIELVKKALQLAKVFNFEIIQAHDWLVGSAALTLKEQLSIPLVSTIHATEFGRNNGIHNELQRSIHQREQDLVNGTEHIIVCSKFMKEEVQQVFKTNKKDITVIPNGIDPRSVEASKEINFKIYEDKRLIFTIGRMVKEKGFETIIEAAPILMKNYPNILFVIAGKGPLLEEFRNKVIDLNLEDVIQFIGFIHDDERNNLLSACEIAVFPSLYEPFGMVALETMVTGIPTIVSEIGGLKGIVKHGKTGLFMKPGDMNSLMEQIQFLLDHREEAQRIGENGQKAAIGIFGWDRIAEETVRVFEDILLNQKMEFHIG